MTTDSKPLQRDPQLSQKTRIEIMSYVVMGVERTIGAVGMRPSSSTREPSVPI
jgi:hypothetical protein